MDDLFIRIYREQILDQINSAEFAYSGINSSSDVNSLFRNIHQFIVHTSNIVKLVQPKISSDLDFKNFRMKQLKKKYSTLPTINPKLIRIRYDFEHYDERIDYWFINSERHNYVDKNVGNVNAIKGLSSKDNFRWYDPKDKKLYFCGEEYPIEELYSYIQEVKNTLK